MFKLFQRKRAPSSTGTSTCLPAKELLRPETAATLLATPRRQRLLEHIWQRTALSRTQFALLYGGPIERYAALVQQFPASETHHHAYRGGMLDHGLEIVAYALTLRQSYLLPVGAPPELQAAQSEAWTAGIAYAALLHDIGKIAVDIDVENAAGERWHPWHGPLKTAYRFRFRTGRAYRLHGAAAGLLYTDVLGQRILDWLSDFPDLWGALLYVLAGQHEHAGILSELIVRADKASVAQELGGNPLKAQQAPKQSLQRKLLDGFRYLIRERLKLNQAEASDGWLTQGGLWLVSKTVCDKLRAHLLSQGVEGVPQRNTDLFNELQAHGLVQQNPQGGAIWRAKVVSSSGWSHSFTFLRLSPALIWEAGSTRPSDFNGTVQIEDNEVEPAVESPIAFVSLNGDANVRGSSRVALTGGPEQGTTGVVVPAHLPGSPSPSSSAPAEPTMNLSPTYEGDSSDHEETTLPIAYDPKSSSPPQPTTSPGMQFVDWLREAIQSRRLIINDARALVHTVSGTAYLVSPGIFMRYAQEHPELSQAARPLKVAEWEWAQKHFEKLRVHKKHASGLNIWTCEVTGPRKNRRLHGYLLLDGRTLFSEVPIDNPHLTLQPENEIAGSNAA